MSNWFVTGVTNGGIGRAIAEAALKRGDRVVGTLRKTDEVAEFEALAPGRAHAVLIDVDRVGEVPAAIDKAIHLLGGRIDIAVNNAGRSVYGAIEEVSVEEAQSVFQTNVFGVMAVMQAVLPHFRANGGGTLINVSSGCGIYAVPGIGIYSASKFALEGMTESLAQEVAGQNITVLLVEPGAIKTNFVSHATKNVARKIDAYANVTGGGKEALGIFYDQAGVPPETVADELMEVLDAGEPPLRVLMGADNRAFARMKLEQMATVAAERP
jgi:NAD(P)-dependent dehydrogenase (short-subunit alcohol dehydrogenase family)